jgi:hypothetical protein
VPPYHYHCPNCRLLYCVGGFHFHWSNDGYWGGTYLVCRGCGTVHLIDHAMRSRRGDGSLEVKRDRFSSQGRPFFVDQQIASERGKLYGDWIEVAVNTTEPLLAEELICGYCNKVGLLSDTWSVEDETCPRCGTLVNDAR